MSKEKAIIVVRVSTQEQDVDQQLPDCEKYCEERGWDVVEVYKEVQSAWKTYIPRKTLNKALAYVRRKRIPHVVFWDMDRFWRNRQKAVETIRAYQELKIQLHFVRQAFLEDIMRAPHPWNEILYDMIINVLSWVAEEESKKRSDRVKKAYKYGKHKNWGRPRIPFTNEQIYKVYLQEGTIRNTREKLPYKTKTGKKKFVSQGKIAEVVRYMKERDNMFKKAKVKNALARPCS